MKYIIANWKMNMDLDQVETWFKKFKDLTKGKKFKNKIIIAPSTPHLYKSSQFCKDHIMECSAQNVSLHEQGAHTGDVGAFEIADFCHYSIIGHSERKEFKEIVLKKRDVCLRHGVTPIVCFVNKDECKDYLTEGAVIAWEDPENISKDGVYREKDPAEIVETYQYFAKEIPGVSVIYGGSVNRDNVGALAKIKNLGGVLVGNASLDPQHFLDIISALE